MQLSSVLIPLVLKGDVLKQRLWGGLVYSRFIVDCQSNWNTLFVNQWQ